MVFPVTIPIADIFGFLGVILAGISSVFIVYRGRIMKLTRNLQAIRAVHVTISGLAGVFIVLHVINYLNMPFTTGIILGYGTFAIAIAVWLTGTAFLERVKDSFFLHSSFSIVFIAMALLHGASSSTNIPPITSDAILVGAVLILLINAVYQLSKIGLLGSPKKAKPPTPTPMVPKKVG